MTLDVDLDLGVKFDLLTGAVDRNTRAQRLRMEREKALAPMDVRITSSGQSPASGDFGLCIGGPDPGFYWMVRRVSISGATVGATAAGSGELYVTALGYPTGTVISGGTSVPAVRDSADLADTFATVNGLVHFYSDHQLVIQEQENLILVVHSPSASTGYRLAAQLQVIRTPSTIAAAVEI